MEKTAVLLNDFWKKKDQFRIKELYGRYITYSHIQSVLQKLGQNLLLEETGKSSCGTSIPLVGFGRGKIKILAWSQMHGNESTTTKAVLDLLNAFVLFPDDPFVKLVESQIELKVIPILNPDGAAAYTRVNANNVDLNRDAQDLSQVESILLRETFNNFQPHFCLNLHDQRTIFSAGSVAKPATVSFLTPAMDEERSVTRAREKSMKVIAAINQMLQEVIPGQVGRYDDSYNINCTGDTYQTLEVPTILFEAGHYKNDYRREKTREYITYSLLAALGAIATGEVNKIDTASYFQIPENEKLFYDVILRNALVDGNLVDVAIQFREELREKEITFVPTIQKIASNLPFYGHKEIECRKGVLKHPEGRSPAENDIVHKLLLKNEILLINYANN